MGSLKHHGPAPLCFCPKPRPHVRLKIGIQIVDGHGAQLVFRIAQHQAGRLVYIQDLGLLIDPVHGVSGPVHREFRKPQGLLHPLAVGNVMGQIDQAGSGPKLDRIDGDHERAYLSGLGPEQPFSIVQVALFPNFSEHNLALRCIGPQSQF